MTMTEKFELAELIREIVREEIQRAVAENKGVDISNDTTTKNENKNENAKAYLEKISPAMKDYMSRYTIIDIAREMRSVLTDEDIKWVIIHLDGKDPYTKKNSRELSEILFK